MPSSSRARWAAAARRSSGWVTSRMVRPTRSSTGRSSMSASERLASRIVESSSRTSAIPVGAEWNACWNRRLACSSARTRSSRSVTSRRRTMAPGLGVPWPVDRRLDERARRPVGVRQADGDRRRCPPAAPVRQPLVEVGARAPARRAPRNGWPVRSADRAAGQLGGLGVGATDDAVVVDRQHRLRQVVEQEAQLGLGVDQPLDRPVEVGGDAPRLEPRDDDGGGGEQRRDDRRGDGAGRTVAVEAQHDDHEGDEQRRGDRRPTAASATSLRAGGSSGRR